MRTMNAATMAVLMATCALSACDARDGSVDAGAPADGSTPGADTGPETDAGPRPDAGPQPDAGPPVPPTGPCGGDVVRMEHLYASPGRATTGRATFGAIQTGTNRLVSFREALSPGLARLPYIELTEEGGVVRTAAVSGDVPAGQVYFTVYHPGLGRFVMLTLERDPFRYVLHTLELGDATATFTRLTAVDPPAGDGFIFTALHPVGANQLVAERGDAVHTVTVDGASVTWGASQPLTLTDLPLVEVADPAGGRVLGFGSTDYDPGTGTVTHRPTVLSRPLPAGDWSELSVGAPPVDLSTLTEYAWAAYDPDADRMLVAAAREVYEEIFMETVVQTGLFAIDLGTGAWTTVADPFYENAISYGAAWAVDASHHRALAWSSDSLVALSTDDDSTGVVSELELDGHPGPGQRGGAAATSDGRLLALSAGRLLVYDPSASAPRWEPFGAVELPSDLRDATLDVDARTGALWILAGRGFASEEAPTRVLRVSADGETVTEPEVSGEAPLSRGYASTLAHDGALILVGGATSAGTRDDVWSLDLDALSWRRLATLPTGRSQTAIRIVGDELWVIGGYDGEGATEDALAIDLASGAVRALAITGELPTSIGAFQGAVPFQGGLVLLQISDNTLDATPLSMFRVTPDGDAARWERLGACFVDWHAQYARGVAVDEDHGYLVGPDLFELTPRP